MRTLLASSLAKSFPIGGLLYLTQVDTPIDFLLVNWLIQISLDSQFCLVFGFTCYRDSSLIFGRESLADMEILQGGLIEILQFFEKILLRPFNGLIGCRQVFICI